MNRPLIAILAGLLLVTSVLSVPGVAAQATTNERLAPVEGAASNTTRMLHLDTADRRGFGTASTSVTAAVGSEAGAGAATLTQYAVAQEFENSPSAGERALDEAIAVSADRIVALETREQRARDRFRAGEIEMEQYLAVLGSVNREAHAIESSLDHFETRAQNESLQDRVRALQTDTARYVGPIADAVGSAVAGGPETDRIYVAAADHGVVLGGLRGGQYVREATRTDARDGTVGTIDLGAAQDRIGELYPWAWTNKGDVSINTVGADVFRFQLSHDHGRLNSLLDTSSGNVYREVQQKSLATLPVAPGPSTTAGNLTLRVSAADPGSPLRVQVTNESGGQVPASVSINGTYAGQTGPESSVWTLAPPENFTVTAEADDQELELDVDPR
ncbi:hypothetical protein HTSR_1813 [Halodesulfurarchaeum formicicum]|uniref:Uncharacterized protein n=1 Tax=Halodesulfurarchaeum formicicum TaxID=1873524 RepID=A0A1D8S6L9_9EURY|nr:hypothetical protein [Halodesulfurarchaeum formicicum]AOW80979.1 hypothetical protein HTSR_1813 [Halodesulfurarchaeum formicicum]APE96315.1 hypothetical protein HSR6_1882 [Halodesulfurarchaeum formicicum]